MSFLELRLVSKSYGEGAVQVHAIEDVNLFVERSHAGRVRLLGGQTVELEGQGDVLHRRQPGQEVELLEDVADGPSSQARLVVAGHRLE